MFGEQITDEQIREAHFVIIRDKKGQEYRLYGMENRDMWPYPSSLRSF